MTIFVLSLIRTLVPIVVGSVLGWLAVIGLQVDAEGAQGLAIFIAGTLSALYYAAVRWLGQKYPGVEILLGSKQTPDGYSASISVPEETVIHINMEDTPPGYDPE